MEIQFALPELQKAARFVLEAAGGRKVLAFYGEMGSGKTTLIAEICRQLGSRDEVSSPTFSIINQYLTEKEGTVYHMDLYRLAGPDEAIRAGVEDCLHSGKICLVEWPERAESVLPEDHLKIQISTLSDNFRNLNIN